MHGLYFHPMLRAKQAQNQAPIQPTRLQLRLPILRRLLRSSRRRRNIHQPLRINSNLLNLGLLTPSRAETFLLGAPAPNLRHKPTNRRISALIHSLLSKKMTKVLEEDITHTARSNTATAAHPSAGIGELIGAHGGDTHVRLSSEDVQHARTQEWELGEDSSWFWAVEGVAVWVGCV